MTLTTDRDTPWEPPLNGTEAEHVLGALDRLRWTFRYKVDELDAAGLDTRIGASSLTLGGLLKHLAVQEDYATAVKLNGEVMPEEWADNGWDREASPRLRYRSPPPGPSTSWTARVTPPSTRCCKPRGRRY